MLKIAFRFAQIPSEHVPSTQTPTYILPETNSTAAATPPASSILEIARGCNTSLAATYKSYQICSIILSPLKFRINSFKNYIIVTAKCQQRALTFSLKPTNFKKV